VNNNTWTWMAGSNTVNQPGFYGEKGIARNDNSPGARISAVGWFDSLREELWLFGGWGYDNTSATGTCVLLIIVKQYIEFNVR